MHSEIKKIYYKLIFFPIGWVGIAGTQKGLSCIQLPEKSKKETKEKLFQKMSAMEQLVDSGLSWMVELEEKLNDLFLSKRPDFRDIPVDIKVSDFQRKVYEKLRSISSRKILTYKELALLIESPNSARAVGMAMGRNPIPLVIPCHRVVLSSKKSLGGFSAYNGIELKKKLIAYENISLDNK